MGDSFTTVTATKMPSRLFELVKKDILAEFRTKSIFSFSLLFAITAAFLFSAAEAEFVPSMILILVFTNILGLSASYLREVDTGTMEGLKASPLSAAEILLAKVIFNIFVSSAILVILFPVSYALFDVAANFAELFAYFEAVNVSVAIAISALTPLVSSSRARELLLPVLMFPILYPVLSSSLDLLMNSNPAALEFLALYSIAILALSLALADYL
ncbi:MAG: ABC transporter permease [Archaeoglobaceae archaeon]